MDHLDVGEAAGSSHAVKDTAVSERKLFRLVAVSFGLLCILQATLNIYLHLSYYSSGTETPDIKASCKNTTETKLRTFDQYFQQGWVYLHPSLYYISSTKKSWQDSREDCQQRGADLMIINSQAEQDFSRKFHVSTWIGLRNTNRGWIWVDGTLLSKTYWGPGEPNDYLRRNEDCVEIKFHDSENSWNDQPCDTKNAWICEMMVSS